MQGYDDDRLIMMVAQQPFEVGLNQFCKLAPLAYLDGTPASYLDFPNDGEIWWMLTLQSARLAEPGTLVMGNAEGAMRFDALDPDSSRYQAVRESVRQIDHHVARELLDVPGEAIDRIQDIVDGGFSLPVDHLPTPQVMLRWRTDVYGPFTATVLPPASSGKLHQVAFAPVDSDMVVFQLTDTQFREAVGEFLLTFSNMVSTTRNRRSESRGLLQVDHVLLLNQGFERFLARNPRRFVLESLRQKLNRFAKNVLANKKRQELRHLLDELEIKGQEADDADDLLQTVRSVKQTITRQDATLDAVAKALLQTGMLGDDRIQKAQEAYAEQYVQERSAALQAQVDQRVVARRDEIEKADADLREIQARLANSQILFEEESRRRRAELEATLAAERQDAENKIAAEHEGLERIRKELEHQQAFLQGSLERVTTELREQGDEVVNRFLTIAPLLGRAGLAGMAGPVDGRTTSGASTATVDAGARPQNGSTLSGVKATPRFELPAFLTRDLVRAEPPMSEEAFFERFKQVVETSGFHYRPLDLIRFHLSVKVGVLTVLVGHLPRLWPLLRRPTLTGRAALKTQPPGGSEDPAS